MAAAVERGVLVGVLIGYHLAHLCELLVIRVIGDIGTDVERARGLKEIVLVNRLAVRLRYILSLNGIVAPAQTSTRRTIANLARQHLTKLGDVALALRRARIAVGQAFVDPARLGVTLEQNLIGVDPPRLKRSRSIANRPLTRRIQSVSRENASIAVDKLIVQGIVSSEQELIVHCLVLDAVTILPLCIRIRIPVRLPRDILINIRARRAVFYGVICDNRRALVAIVTELHKVIRAANRVAVRILCNTRQRGRGVIGLRRRHGVDHNLAAQDLA